MLDVKYDKFLNEEMAFISNQKLRDALHDIIVSLEPKEILEIEDLVNRLQSEYKITISPFFLDKFLDDFLRAKRGDRKAKTFFKKSDSRWLGVRDIKGTKQVRNNLLHLKPSLTKHKRRLFEEEEKDKLEKAYKSGMKNLNFTEDIIKKSLVLQRPEDSADIMKMIYSDVMMEKKYENTYDNCWKLMMLISKNYNFDRIRGWFKLAPKSVRDEYYNSPEGQRKINYELTKLKNDEKSKNVEIEEVDPITKSNLDYIDKYLKNIKNWKDFISNFLLKDIINIANNMKTSTPFKGKKFEEFLAKLDQLNLILIKYYRVEKKDVIMFYKNIGLAGYLRKWESTKKRPLINDF